MPNRSITNQYEPVTPTYDRDEGAIQHSISFS